MHAMFGDEVLAEGARKFFIYGGVFVDIDELPAIHNAIETLRRDAGLGSADTLKYSAKGRPAALSPEQHKELKSAIIALAEQHDVTFCAHLVLQAIATVGQADTVQWGCNTVLMRFNEFLQEHNDHGLVLLDRFSDHADKAYKYAKTKFQRGLTFGRDPDKPLDRILGVGFTCDGATHMSSVADILLGTLGYCVSEGIKTEAARAMFPPLARLMWKRVGQTTAIESGFNLRPRIEDVKSLRYRGMYTDLISRLGEYAKAGMQNAA
jgi:hypothetical protein